MRGLFQPIYHRWWRRAARTWPLARKREWLPGWTWLELFVNSYVLAGPSERQNIIGQALVDGLTERRALERAGGARAAVKLVSKHWNDEFLEAVQACWPDGIGPDEIAANLVQISHAMTIRITA